MNIRKTGEFTLDYEQLFQDERFQAWIVEMLIESEQMIDPPGITQQHVEEFKKKYGTQESPVQRNN